MSDQPTFTLKPTTISEPFRRFAALLDDPDRLKIVAALDGRGELAGLVRQLKAFAWEKAGVSLSTFGDDGDPSLPVADFQDVLDGKPNPAVPRLLAAPLSEAN